jgi:hypothetical protein
MVRLPWKCGMTQRAKSSKLRSVSSRLAHSWARNSTPPAPPSVYSSSRSMPLMMVSGLPTRVVPAFSPSPSGFSLRIGGRPRVSLK